MSGRMMHSRTARRYVRGAQMGALALGVAAAALWALDVPGLSGGAAPVVPPPAPPVTAPAEGVVRPVAMDMETVVAVSERLNAAREKPKDAGATSGTIPPPPPPSGPQWKYLGPVFEPKRRLALVNIDGVQRMVAEGRKIGPLTLVAVDTDIIMVRDEAGVEHEIRREERQGSGVAWATMPAITPAPRPAVGNQATNPGVTAEMEKRLRERGIDPAQAERARQLMLERNKQKGRPEPTQVQPAAETDG